jgi:uncharacterized protein (TIGR00255 family)
MIKSMTGYGRGEVEALGQKWVVELRSLNHRFLELSLNLPKHLWALEDRFRKLLKSRLARGRVEVQLTWERDTERSSSLRLDPGLVAETKEILRQLRLDTDEPENLRLEHFLHFSEILVTRERPTLELEETWELLNQALAQALTALEEMRLREGAALLGEILSHLESFRQQSQRISEQAALLPQLWQKKLGERLEELLQPSGLLDEGRLAQEVALLAERRDIAEELARLESHLDQFRQTLEGREPAGRKLEFLLQEMLREVNTIGAKAGDLEVTQAVLEIKGVLERLREQVQNVE